MDEQLTISTPEQVAFHYEAAGIGSRFVAALVDHLIIGIALVLISCAASALSLTAVVADLGGEGNAGQATAYVVIALLVLVLFLILWGYFALFEIVWRGRTPGKRMFRLRVLKRSGQPIGTGEAVVRNLVRLVDFMPGFYAIGLISMFADKEARRLGDLAAGTVVVREGEQVGLRDVSVTPSSSPASTESPQPAYENPRSQGGANAYTPDFTRYTPGQYTPPAQVITRFDPLPGVSLSNLTPQDYQLIREVLERWRRGEMSADRMRELATRLAYGVAGRMGHNFAEWQGRGWDPLVFLQSVLQAREARGG